MIDLFLEKIQQLDKYKKFEIYLRYFIAMSAMKYEFIFLDKMKEDWKHGYGTPDKEFCGVGLYFLWKNLYIPTFEEFISDDNVLVTDNGEKWKEQGRAQRYHTRVFGIYDYCRKNQDLI